jgi:hypothetical protein
MALSLFEPIATAEILMALTLFEPIATAEMRRHHDLSAEATQVH